MLVYSQTNRAYLTRGGGNYIHAEKLRVKEVAVAPGGDGETNSGARAPFVICHNPERGERDQHLVEHLQGLIAGSDEWSPA